MLWRRTPGAVVLLTHQAREPFSLTGSGPALWELLADALDESELCQRLAGLHDADATEIASDVHQTLLTLSERGAVAYRT